MDEAKKKHRPKLKDWGKDKFATTRKKDFDTLKICPNSTAVSLLDGYNLTVFDFINKYEMSEKPVIIDNIPSSENWPAKDWNFKRLKEFKESLFKVGEDDDGFKVKSKMKYFLKYIKNNGDDSPLYIFDGHFDSDRVSKVLLKEFAVPSYFPDDLFRLVGEDRRPPYRWFLVGPG